jgi:hypothetical protein
MKKQNKLIPINSANLGTYFSSAIIVPRSFIKEDTQDLQSTYSEAIVFSDQYFTTNSDCCIEVLLTADEIANINHSTNDSISFYFGAIPITRISAIYFHSKEKAQRTSGLISSAAYFPERLIKIIDRGEMSESASADVKNLSMHHSDTIKQKISTFDKYLGGLTFMKHGGPSYSNYSTNYISTLNIFTKSIDSDVRTAKRKTDIEDKYIAYFDSNNNQMNDFRSKIEGDDNDIASFIGDKVPIRNNKYLQDEVRGNKILYMYSILSNYGPDQTKPLGTESLLKSMLIENIAHRESVSLYFGVHVGYKALKKSYVIDNDVLSTKNELASKLDYYTIESVYQYVFNHNNTGAHSFLKPHIPKCTKVVDHKKYKTYKVYDEDIIYAVKPGSIKELMSNYLKETRFHRVLSAISGRFQKKNNFEFTASQKDHFENGYFDTIHNPLQEHLSSLEIELDDYINEKIKKFEGDIQQKEKDISKLNQKLSQERNKRESLQISVTSESPTDKKPKFEPKVDIINSPDTGKKAQLNIHEYYLKNATITFLKKIAVQRKLPLRDKISRDELTEMLINHFRDELDNLLS